ncbi:NAD(P)H-hydrate dehydratase [Argonema antarcticum]|uniref:NAD(P)H-hydrate dehydratase n=1 Tax=Argonema antarcticum TaxID=2942763 RepID=UPI0020119C77|nr:NAD(P)H-hydrate dehydratase [Argonema antarcticum]MCL1471097.1 NAD(P)H-hydrate dehydratase [Argonema antarcticum A004/B2]
MDRLEKIQQVVVTSQQMREIEGRIFAAGMPVAALMEKVANLIVRRITGDWGALEWERGRVGETTGKTNADSSLMRASVPIRVVPSGGEKIIPNFQSLISYNPKSKIQNPKSPRVGILVGPGHNGGDALVVARELHFQGYEIVIYHPFTKLKELTAQHAQYANSLGIPFVEEISLLSDCDLIIDGLFGFGLERAITDPIAAAIDRINQLSKPIISIDLPSGLHTDTGEVLGTAIRATHTLCLGLWKQGLLQDRALEYVGKAELIDFDIPLADIAAVLGETPEIQRVTEAFAIAHLPLSRPPVTHKYKMGHLLLICGSRKYAGGAILTGLGARASGVGMLSIAVPESLKSLLVSHLPEALIIGCPETESGAISQLPEEIDLGSYSAIACGPGLTKDARPVVQAVLESELPLLLDADGLNILAQMGTIPKLSKRQAITVLTPHTGEFKRLFPDAPDPTTDRVSAVREASRLSGAIVLLKGARTAIANPSGSVWIIPESTPALARGGSGDVLTGLVGGLLAQTSSQELSLEAIVAAGAWWHAQAGILAAQERTDLGVDAFTLTQYLIPVISSVE